jgi:hypothetical protein
MLNAHAIKPQGIRNKPRIDADSHGFFVTLFYQQDNVASGFGPSFGIRTSVFAIPLGVLPPLREEPAAAKF